MASKLLESDLSQPIIELLEAQGYRVRSEVRDCDIAATKDNQLVVVELKRNLSVTLLGQAVDRQRFADAVYVAVPKPKRHNGSRWRETIHLLRRLELGLLLVSFRGERALVE